MTRRPSFRFWALAIAVLVLDQVTKAYIRGNLSVGESIPVIEDIFHITYVRNVGAAFGLMAGARPLFVATTVLVLIAIFAYWRRDRPSHAVVITALALVTAGAIGNLIDRVVDGRVTDFLHVVAIRFPVFNVADVSIVLGVVLLIGWLLLSQPERTGD